MTSVQSRVDEIREMEVTEVKKRKSGEAFEVLIKTPGQKGDSASPLKRVTQPPKKDLTIDDVQGKLQAAEERRKAKQEEMLNQLKAEEEKIVKVQMRRDAVSQWAAEHLKSKMIKYEANHLSFLQSKIDKCRSHNMSLEDMREKVKQEVDKMCTQYDENLKKKMTKSEELRQQKLQEVLNKQKELEARAMKVRKQHEQNKQLEDKTNQAEVTEGQGQGYHA